MAKKIKEYRVTGLFTHYPNHESERIGERVYLADEVDKVIETNARMATGVYEAQEERWQKAYAEAWKEINNIGADDPDDGDPESITCGNVVSSCLDILKKHMGEPTKSSEIKVNDCHCKLSQSETIPVSEDAKGSSEIPKNEIAGASRDQSIVDKRASGLNKGGVRKE